MINGNIINKNTHPAFDLEKALGNDYDKIIRNENISFIFFIGPLYFAYRNYFFLGLLLEFINIGSYLFFCRNMYIILGNLPVLYSYVFLFSYFVLNKLFWMMVCNPIYTFIINRKIKKIKKKYGNNKDDYIINIKIRNIYKLNLLIILFITLPFIILFLYKLVKSTL